MIIKILLGTAIVVAGSLWEWCGRHPDLKNIKEVTKKELLIIYHQASIGEGISVILHGLTFSYRYDRTYDHGATVVKLIVTFPKSRFRGKPKPVLTIELRDDMVESWMMEDNEDRGNNPTYAEKQALSAICDRVAAAAYLRLG